MIEFVRLEDGLYRRGLGGDTSNAAIAAARQGASVGYATALGADRFGDAVLAAWEAEGVDTAHVWRDADAPTGIYFVEPDPAGRHFTYYRAGSAASRMRPEHLPEAAVRACRCLHLSGITLAVSDQLRTTAEAAVEMAAGAGAAVSLDTNLRLKLWDAATARERIHRTMARATVAVTSVEDSRHLTGLSSPGDIARHYRSLGPTLVLVTLGAEGCLLASNDGLHAVPPAPAQPVDSTGAGDSFAGAFLAWWLETGDPRLAAERAALVAAGTVSGYGAVAPIPRRAEVLAGQR